MNNDALVVLNPTAEPKIVMENLASRVSDLNNCVICFLWNGKPNGNILLEKIEEALKKSYRFKKILRRRKENYSAGASEGLLNELAASCNVVINAVGDCGSCSSWLTYDSVMLEKKGVPTARH